MLFLYWWHALLFCSGVSRVIPERNPIIARFVSFWVILHFYHHVDSRGMTRTIRRRRHGDCHAEEVRECLLGFSVRVAVRFHVV